MIFEESDALALGLNTAMPENQRCQRLIWDCVTFECGQLDMGRSLLGFLKKKDMAIVAYRTVAALDYR